MKCLKIQRYILWTMLILLQCFILAGCGDYYTNNTIRTNTKVVEDEEKYDSQFTGILQGIDRNKKTCDFYDIKTGSLKQYSFTGGTSIQNRYEKEQTSLYLEPGRIFDVYFEESNKKLVKLVENSDAFEYRKVNDLEFHNSEYMITMVGKKFFFDDSMMIFSGDDAITQIELNRQDELTVRGMGSQVYSVQVTQGHGYVTFVNYADFIGGYVSIGDYYVSTITEDMLIAAKEGTYTLAMENGELSGSKKITVEKDKRIVVDMSEFQMAPDRIGNIRFIISPSTANLYINDSRVDFSRNVKLNFGTHRIKVLMDGYQQFNGVLTVSGNQSQTIEITLAQAGGGRTGIGNDNGDSQLIELPNDDDRDNKDDDEDNKDDDGDNDGSSDNDDGDDSEDDDYGTDEGHGSSTPTPVREDKNHSIIISGPAGVSVYMDGTLIGTAPASVKKVTGNHTITLYKSGYITKSYEIEAEDDNKDLTLEFPALLPDN